MSKTLPRPLWITLTFSLWLAACGGGGGSGGGTTTTPVVHSGGSVMAFGVAVDASRNVYVAGYTDGGLDGNTRVGQNDMFLVMYDATGKKVRTRELGTPGGNVYASAVAVDGHGDVYIVGYTDVGVDGQAMIGVNDAFVTKYDSAGNKVRTITFGVAGHQTHVSSIALDGAGNVYVAGDTDGSLNGNSVTGRRDLFYSKYDSAGTLLLTRQLGVGGALTGARAIAVDSAGSVYLAGLTDGGLDGNTQSGTRDMIVVVYDAQGNKVRTRQLGVAGAQTSAKSIAVDGAGRVLVAGTTTGGLDGNFLIGTMDTFLTIYDPSGNRLHTRQIGAAGRDTLVGGVCVDSNGNRFVAGGTTGGLDGNIVTGAYDLFLSEFDSADNKVGTIQFGVAGAMTGATAIAVDALNNLYLSGTTQGALDGNSFVGNLDSFYTIFDSSGHKVRTKEFGVPVI